jgi:hypothetical protein
MLKMTIFTRELNNTGGSLFVGMTRSSDEAPIASCILDWGLMNRGKAEAHPLPESLANALKNTMEQID